MEFLHGFFVSGHFLASHVHGNGYYGIFDFLVSFDGGTTWEKVTEETFPDDGLTIQDGWKTVQEMQLNAPDMVPLCASVSAKDLSEPFELHPQNKSILGARFAEKALLWV